MTSGSPSPRASIEPYERARHGDGPARVIEGVYREFGFTWEPDGYHQDVVRPEHHYRTPSTFFDVAVIDGVVIGTVGGECKHDVAELRRLYLDARFRGLGVGRALLDRFLSWARSVGCRKAILWSDKRFVDAHRLYAAAGFVTLGDRICPGDPDFSDEWGCERAL